MSLFARLDSESIRSRVKSSAPRITTWFASRKDVDSLFNPVRGVSASDNLDFEKLRSDVTLVLNQLTAEIDAIRADGTITFKEVISFCVRLFQLVLPVLQSFPSSAIRQKDLALEIADEFYLRVLAPLDIPYVPAFIENSFLDPAIGRLWHEAASGLYDSLLQFFPVPSNQ